MRFSSHFCFLFLVGFSQWSYKNVYLHLSLAYLVLQTETIIMKIMQPKLRKTKNELTKICNEPGSKRKNKLIFGRKGIIAQHCIDWLQCRNFTRESKEGVMKPLKSAFCLEHTSHEIIKPWHTMNVRKWREIPDKKSSLFSKKKTAFLSGVSLHFRTFFAHYSFSLPKISKHLQL